MSVRQLTPPPYHPLFTRRPGTKIHLAGSSHVIQVFPTALRVYAYREFELELVKELFFPALEPFSDWVAYTDCMRQYIQIEGRGHQGFVRYRIGVTADGVFLKPSSGPLDVMEYGVKNVVTKGDDFPIVNVRCSLPRFPTPRLLLGCNKAPNWDRISDTPTMEEVLPLWYQLSAPAAEMVIEPSATLFGAVVEAWQKQAAASFLPAFATYFHAGIEGVFVPKRTDDLFLGYKVPLLPDEMALSDVHPRVCSILRSLFFRQTGNVIDILPCLPKELVSGRLLHETLLSGHHIDIEWRKSRVRRVLLHAEHDGMVTVKADALKATIRMLGGGSRKKVFAIGGELEVQGGKSYLLDNFST